MTIILGGTNPAVTFPDATTQNTAGLPLTGGTLSGAVVVPTLNTPSGVLATQNGMTGIAKAWCNYNAITATINGSFNISSVTRNSVGNYTVNFTTAMTNANYAVSFGAGNASGGVGYGRAQAIGSISTTQLQFINVEATNNTLLDDTITSVTIFSN